MYYGLFGRAGNRKKPILDSLFLVEMGENELFNLIFFSCGRKRESGTYNIIEW